MTENEWAQRISDGALREVGRPPEPIPWIKAPCDFCLEGLPKDAEGWHLRRDEEGVEGTARIPCSTS